MSKFNCENFTNNSLHFTTTSLAKENDLTQIILIISEFKAIIKLEKCILLEVCCFIRRSMMIDMVNKIRETKSPPHKPYYNPF